MAKNTSTELKQKIADELDFRKFVEELLHQQPAKVEKNGTELKFICPFGSHDTDPSFNFNTNKGVYHCFGCGEEGSFVDLYMEMENVEFKTAMEELADRTSLSQPDPSLTLEQYAEAKNLDQELLEDLGIRNDTWSGDQAIRIPYYDENGELFRSRCRTALYDPPGDSRFKWYPDGEGQILYGLRHLDKYNGKVLLVEGESDCHTLWNAWENYPVLGVPGKSNYTNLYEQWGEYLEDFDKITLLQENDAQKQVEEAAADLTENTDADVYVLDLPTDDVNDLYNKDRRSFEDNWSEATSNKTEFKNNGKTDGSNKPLTTEPPQSANSSKDASENQDSSDPWSPSLTKLATVESEEITWLWEPYIPRKKITILDGDPGVGKTFLALQLAARVSTGDTFLDPRKPARDPENVLYMTAEDGLGDTLRPRVDRLKGDPEKIHVLKHKKNNESKEKNFLSLQDTALIAKSLQEVNPGLVIVDPLQGFLGDEVDMYRANEVRPILADIADLVEKFDAAVVMIRHLTKSSKGKSIYRGLGSIDFAAQARSILLAGKDPDNKKQKAMIHIKSNLAETGASQGFQLNENGFHWTGESDINAQDIMEPEKSRSEKNKFEQAVEFLKTELAEGPIRSTEIKDTAKEELNISQSTIENAYRDGLNGKAFKDGKHWYWRLPEKSEAKGGG